MSDKEIIKKSLRFNDMAYAQMVYKNGLLWIGRYFSDEITQDLIQRSAMYWAWWKQQWSLCDAQFVFEACLHKQELPLTDNYLLVALDLYYDIHQVANLKIVPNRYVISDISKILTEYIQKEEQKVKQLTNEK